MSRRPNDGSFTRHRAAPYGLAFLLILGLYALLHTRYRIYYVDDAWYLSYVYNHAFHGVDLDTLVRAPGHPRSVLYFGKLSSILYSQFLDVLGWTKGSAHVVSSLFLFMTAGAWYAILRSLRFSFEVSVTTALGMLVFPAFFSSANLTRPDTLALLAASSGLLAFIKERYLLSGFACMVAIEVHIMGACSGFYVLAYILYRREEFLGRRLQLLKKLAWFLGGVALGCAYYYALHHRYFELGAAWRGVSQHPPMAFPVKNYIVGYFFGMDWLQKLPELVFTAAMLIVFWWRLRSRAHPFVRIFLAVMLASTLVMRRPNSNYMLYLEPALVLAFVHSFELWGRLKQYSAAVFGYFLLYYGAIWVRHSDFHFQRVTESIRAALVRPDLPVIGMMDNWFAAMDRTFYPIYPSASPISERQFSEAYLIRNEYVRSRVRNYDSTLRYINEGFELTQIRSVPAYDGQSAEIYHIKRR